MCQRMRGKSHLGRNEDNGSGCDLGIRKFGICRICQDAEGKGQELRKLLPRFRAIANQNPQKTIKACLGVDLLAAVVKDADSFLWLTPERGKKNLHKTQTHYGKAEKITKKF